MSKAPKGFRNPKQARTPLPEDIESPEVWAEKNCQRMPEKDTFVYNFHSHKNIFSVLLRLTGNGWEAGLNMPKPRYSTRYHKTALNALIAYIDRIITDNVKVITEMKKCRTVLVDKENDHENR